jgi:hypothetical protein
VAVDLGKYLAHWVAVAWSEHAAGHVVDYGRLEIASADVGVEKAILQALRGFRDVIASGWPVGAIGGAVMTPQQVWIDSGYMAPVVYAFCREAEAPYQAAIGRGAGQQRHQWYNRPTKSGSIVKKIGEEYHFNRLSAERLLLAEINSDYWKSWVHQRLTTPLDAASAMTLFQAPGDEHLSFVKHLTAERKIEEFVAGKGVIVKWERIRKQNHWFDALYNASAAGHYSGARLVEDSPREPRPAKSLAQLAAEALRRDLRRA